MTNEQASMPTGYVGAVVSAFDLGEVAIAACVALLVEVLFFTVLVRAGSTTHLREQEARVAKPVPISVKPVLDDLPLLKLGGGKKYRAKLPDMWKKQAPIKRYEARSAPSELAQDRVDAIPTSELATADAAAPPPDAQLALEVDELMQPEAGAETESNLPGEGSPDGVKEGTETDPLKARWVSQYQMRILAWFNARFTPPATGAPCEELKNLTAAVAANVGPDRTVVGYAITRPSGNATFDGRVRATMDSIRGQQLPPPPPLYPDILGSTVYPVFSGRKSQCTPAAPASPSPPSSASP
jgi:hypothetical protein